MPDISRRAVVAGLGSCLLPMPRAFGRQPTVAVVGAGLAGLAAAWDLKQAGATVRLLEQSRRAGGRIKTVRGHFADGAWVDVGGQTSGGGYANFFYYSSLFGLEFEPQQEFRQRPDYLLHLNRQLLTGRAIRENPALWPIELHEQEKPLAPFRLLRHYLQPIAEKIGRVENVLDGEFSGLDALSLRELLEREGASKAAIKLIDHTLNYNSVDSVSALSALRDAVRSLSMSGGQALNLKNGNASLTDAFADELKAEIRYGCRLTAIWQQDDGVALIVDDAGIRNSVTADFVILAIPFTALRKVHVEPGLPPSRQRIVDELPYTQIVQTWLQTRSRFWETDGALSIVLSDGPLERLFDGSRQFSGSRGMLINWVNGSGARVLQEMSAADRVATIIDNLNAIWPGADKEIETTLSNDWGDSYAEGAYAHYAPGQMARHAGEIPQPVGRLYFAGEHTELVAPGMEGALTSGRRAASQIVDAMR